jgi:DNA invertase Pin-like site-specific DNA recombinase
MSTEHQRYSPDNQEAAIATYAALCGFEVTETYQDSGKSGLSLKGRPALKQLLSDVLSGAASYRAVLVLDVSRWGRFQDTDQSAHYEYMCREAGVDVHYCNEPFGNDGGTMTSIVKHMKRVMAAEYSRELSTKVSRAQRQQARLGFKQGGIPPFGTRRQVINQNGTPLFVLSQGERKALVTDRVTLIWGPKEEIALVRRIFRLFLDKQLNQTEISRWLNEHGYKQGHGADWTPAAVKFILKNEIYVGRYLFGRNYNNVGNRAPSPKSEWISVDVIKPIIALSAFKKVQVRLKDNRFPSWTDAELLAGLKRLLDEQGGLTSYILQNCRYLPYPSTYVRRFGSLREAFALVGYCDLKLWKQNSTRYGWTEAELIAALQRMHAEHGCVDTRIINQDRLSPCKALFAYKFGGLTNAFLLAGLPVGRMSPSLQKSLVRQRAQHALRNAGRGAPVLRTTEGRRITNDDLFAALRRLFATHGFITSDLIDADRTIPSSSFFRTRLGRLREAYEQVGYHTTQSEIVRAALGRARARRLAEAQSV